MTGTISAYDMRRALQYLAKARDEIKLVVPTLISEGFAGSSVPDRTGAALALLDMAIDKLSAAAIVSVAIAAE